MIFVPLKPRLTHDGTCIDTGIPVLKVFYSRCALFPCLWLPLPCTHHKYLIANIRGRVAVYNWWSGGERIIGAACFEVLTLYLYRYHMYTAFLKPATQLTRKAHERAPTQACDAYCCIADASTSKTHEESGLCVSYVPGLRYTHKATSKICMAYW